MARQQQIQAQARQQKQQSSGFRRRMGITFRQPFVITGLVATAASVFVIPQMFVPLALLFVAAPVMTAAFPSAARLAHDAIGGVSSLFSRAYRGLGRAVVSPFRGWLSRDSRKSHAGHGRMEVPVTRQEQARARAYDERHGRDSKDAVVQQLVDRLRDSGLRVNTDWDAAMRELKASPDWQYFRTKPVIYGFVYKGVIHINTEKSSMQTPIHEYTHVWAEVMRQRNPDEWDHIVRLMQQDRKLWNHIKKSYPHLNTDDEIADEVLAAYSGRQGAERLKQLGKAVGGQSVLGKMFEALDRFWKAVGEFFDIHYNSREEVADRVLYDLLSGVNPIELLQEGASWNDSHPQHHVSDDGKDLPAETVRVSIGDQPEEVSEANIEKAVRFAGPAISHVRTAGGKPTAVCLVTGRPVDVPSTGAVHGLCVFDDQRLSRPLLLVTTDGGFKAVPVTAVPEEDFDRITDALGRSSLPVSFTDISDGRRYIDFYRPGYTGFTRYPVDALQRQLASLYRINEDPLNPGSFVAVDRIDPSIPSSLAFIAENGSRLLSRGTLVRRDSGDLVIELEGAPGRKDVTGMVSADISSAKFFAGRMHGRFEDFGDVRSVTFPYSSERDNAADASCFMQCYKNWPGKALAAVSGRTAFGGMSEGMDYRPLSDVERLQLFNFLREYESSPAFRNGWCGRRMAPVLDDDFMSNHGLDGTESLSALRRDLQDIHADAALAVLTEGRQRDLFYDCEHTAGRRVLGFRAGEEGEHEVYVADIGNCVSLQPFCYHHERLLLQTLTELREKYLGRGGGTLPSVGLDEAVRTVSAKALSPVDGYDAYGRFVLDSFFSQVPQGFRHSLAELVGVRAEASLSGRIHNDRWLAAAREGAAAIADGVALDSARGRGLSV